MRGSGEKVPDVFFITLTLFFKENMMQFYYPVLFPFRLEKILMPLFTTGPANKRINSRNF
jgi:hypothetical protein